MVEDAIDEPSPSAWKRARLVVAVALLRVVAASVVALPIGVAAARAAGKTRAPDAAIFEPGGYLLLEALRWSLKSSASIVVPSTMLVIVTATLGHATFALLAAGFSRRGELDAGFLAGRTLRAFPSLVLVGGLGLVAEVLLFVVVNLVGNKLVDATLTEPPGADLARVGVAMVALLAAAALGAAGDLVRASLVVRDLPIVLAVRAGFRALASKPAGVLARWLGASVVALVVLAAGAWIAPPLAPVDATPLALAFVVHQAAFTIATFARASWIASAVERVLATTRGARIEIEIERASASGSEPVAVAAAAPARAPSATNKPRVDVDATLKSATDADAPAPDAPDEEPPS